MKSFISWSKEKSRVAAMALRKWLPLFLPTAKPWMCDDTPPGSVWGSILARELEETVFGIICLTRKNENSKWLHFEAGALSKVFGKATVIPLLIDLAASDLDGPLKQFQAVPANLDGLLQVLRDAAPSDVAADDIQSLFGLVGDQFVTELLDHPESSATGVTREVAVVKSGNSVDERASGWLIPTGTGIQDLAFHFTNQNTEREIIVYEQNANQDAGISGHGWMRIASGLSEGKRPSNVSTCDNSSRIFVAAFHKEGQANPHLLWRNGVPHYFVKARRSLIFQFDHQQFGSSHLVLTPKLQ